MTATVDYTDFLRTLSEGSVRKHFDAFEDIAWDDPEFAVVPDDPRWVLPQVDPLGSHAWYLAQPLERQIEIGMARQACIAKVGWQFESVLIRGILEYTFWSKNNDPQFRYLMHEVTEETHHIQMFQELVNRIGVDTTGARPWFKWVQTFLPMAGRWVPAIFIALAVTGLLLVGTRESATVNFILVCVKLAALAAFCLVIRYGVIAREEVYLERKFGRGYLDYKERVRRWI